MKRLSKRSLVLVAGVAILNGMVEKIDKRKNKFIGENKTHIKNLIAAVQEDHVALNDFMMARPEDALLVNTIHADMLKSSPTGAVDLLVFYYLLKELYENISCKNIDETDETDILTFEDKDYAILLDIEKSILNGGSNYSNDITEDIWVLTNTIVTVGRNTAGIDGKFTTADVSRKSNKFSKENRG